MSLINKTRVKRTTLDLYKKMRGVPKERVSAEVYVWLEAEVLNLIKRMVRDDPSKGVTIYPPASVIIRNTR